jgi:hypothetical protein
MPASADFFVIPPSALGASVEIRVNAFKDSVTTSSTLAILLFFGVAAEIFDAFGTSILSNGLRAFGCSMDFFSGSSADFALASIGPGRGGSDAQEDPSINFDTLAIHYAWAGESKP